MGRKRSSKGVPGRFLNQAGAEKGTASGSSKAGKNTFAALSESEGKKEEGVFISLTDVMENFEDDQDREKLAQITMKAVQAAVQAAIPAVIKAVKDTCISKEEMNPHILRSQFKVDALEQYTRRENLRFMGIQESNDENVDDLTRKIVKVADKAGVKISESDISTCHRLGSPTKSKGKPRQVIMRFTTMKKRNELYDSRFKLKGKDACKGVFINEDLTTVRYSILMAAKKATTVKGVSTKNGNIICKMNDDTYKTLRSPDDLFDIGVDDVAYDNFGLHILA